MTPPRALLTAIATVGIAWTIMAAVYLYARSKIPEAVEREMAETEAPDVATEEYLAELFLSPPDPILFRVASPPTWLSPSGDAWCSTISAPDGTPVFMLCSPSTLKYIKEAP